jgi:hypothetical protein
MHAATLGIAALALVAGLAAPAQATAYCAPSSAVVAMEADLPEPVVDNSLPQPTLQDFAGKRYHGGRTLGLYRMTLTIDWTARLVRSAVDGKICLSIDHVTLHVAMSSRRIYIVRERRPGTCAYESVLAHERKHQVVDDEVMTEELPRLRASVARAIVALPPTSPIPAADAAIAERLLTQPVAEAVQSGWDELAAARAARQATVDTADEYSRVRAACG